jgi:hypothetical protein
VNRNVRFLAALFGQAYLTIDERWDILDIIQAQLMGCIGKFAIVGNKMIHLPGNLKVLTNLFFVVTTWIAEARDDISTGLRFNCRRKSELKKVTLLGIRSTTCGR